MELVIIGILFFLLFLTAGKELTEQERKQRMILSLMPVVTIIVLVMYIRYRYKKNRDLNRPASYYKNIKS